MFIAVYSDANVLKWLLCLLAPVKSQLIFGMATERPDLSVSKWFSLLSPGMVTFRSGARHWLLVFIKKNIHARIKWAFWEMAQSQLSRRHISVPLLGAMNVMTDKYGTLLTFLVVFMFWYCFQIKIILMDTEVTLNTTKPEFFRNKGDQNVTVISSLYLCTSCLHLEIIPYPTAFPYGNGMVLHFYQQQESSTTKTVHKVINKGLKTYV